MAVQKESSGQPTEHMTFYAPHVFVEARYAGASFDMVTLSRLKQPRSFSKISVLGRAGPKPESEGEL